MHNVTLHDPADTLSDDPPPRRHVSHDTPSRSHNTERAGEILGISRRHMRRLIATGELKAFRLGRAYRVTDAALAEFQRSRLVNQG